MTIKVTYNVTDIYVSESVSSTYINVSYEAPSGGGGAVWGDIIGTLSDQADLQAALDAKVPYSGATANVDLGEFELKAGQIEYDQTPTGVAGVAVTRWNDSTGTIETTLKGGSVVLEHGRDMFERIVNKTGIQLTKAAYQAVRVSNAQGQRLAVQLAQANNDNNSADTIGLVVETIDNNQEGYIYTVGEIDGVNTTGTLQGETWVDGDVLYLSPTTAGRITNVKPLAPQHLVIIGYVVYAHQNNGKIYVKVMNGWELGELHDVDTTGATNGQVLKYNGTIWTPSTDVGITGSGVTGQVSYWNGTNTQTGSNNLFWDAANNRLGVGTNNPLVTLHANGIIQTNGNNAITGNGVSIGYLDNNYGWIQSWGTNPLLLNGTDNNVMIGVWPGSDNGNKLQVYGSTFLKGGGNTSATDALNIVNSASTNLLKIRNDGSTLFSSSVTANSLVKTGGTSSQYLMADGSTSTLTNPITGTGTTNFLPKFTGTTTLGNSLLREGTNAIGLDSATSLWPNDWTGIDISKNSAISGVTSLSIANNAFFNGTNWIYKTSADSVNVFQLRNAGGFNWLNAGLGTAGTIASLTLQMRLHATGNLTIGSTAATDSGQRLQVTGDTLMKGSGNTSATTALTVQNSASSNLLRILNDGTHKIGNENIDIFPTANGTSVAINGRGLIISTSAGSQSGVGALKIVGNYTSAISNDYGLWISHSFLNGAGGIATHSGLLLNQTINQTGGANGITRGLYVNPTLTAAADWRSIEWSNNSGWGLYGAGTAPNYMGGSLGIGTTAVATHALLIQKNITGSSNVNHILNLSQIRSDVFVSANIFVSYPSTQATSFTLGKLNHFYAIQQPLGAGSVITEQFGFHAGDLLVGATNNYGFYGNIAAATGRWNAYMNGSAANYFNGNTIIGTLAADSGEKLQVTGTMKVTGASTFGGNMTLSLNQNAVTSLTISNTTDGNTAGSAISLTSDAASGTLTIGKRANLRTAYKILGGGDAQIYNSSGADISILNDAATGQIKMAAGGSSTAHMTIKSNGRINMSSLPTSSAGLSAGDLWNDAGTLKIV